MKRILDWFWLLWQLMKCLPALMLLGLHEFVHWGARKLRGKYPWERRR